VHRQWAEAASPAGVSRHSAVSSCDRARPKGSIVPLRRGRSPCTALREGSGESETCAGGRPGQECKCGEASEEGRGGERPALWL
jgi:hypothetical protein